MESDACHSPRMIIQGFRPRRRMEREFKQQCSRTEIASSVSALTRALTSDLQDVEQRQALQRHCKPIKSVKIVDTDTRYDDGAQFSPKSDPIDIRFASDYQRAVCAWYHRAVSAYNRRTVLE